MSFTYNETAATDIDRLRRLIGDTRADAPELSNEELADYLSDADGRLYYAAIDAVDDLAARYARDVDVRMQQTSESASQRAAGYRALGARLRRRAVQSAGIIGNGSTRSSDRSTVETFFTRSEDR